ncbi:ATP-binding protein [Aromatoleum petrolei]|uniref:ATP-binding protein n=1 Tax=Aromatoleum petrolei TaxID=76116 RepID=A0ABX1MPA0_9RHOO|nr:ATP-binding protein [Aromatoleum petrolei]NMF88170.1 ATP-binding protein [Aromatoleum petrolei]QTQ38970.1 Putative molecular chaperone, Hsp90 family [Aromatoleum petrolei]
MNAQAIDKIVFEVDISKMIELLAAQIYPSPLALLRENIQNSFDAILQRLHAGDIFEPLIDVTITPQEITITDNGKGMSVAELRNNFWKAGSSSKNTPEAQAAGVVGTFGIGAMANFGIASSLSVETESIQTRERTVCSAEKAKLSVTEECITFQSLEPAGQFGTTIRASIARGSEVDVHGATEYIREFVKYLRFPVRVNGVIVSLSDMSSAVPSFAQAWKSSGGGISFGHGVTGDFELEVAGTGETRIALSNVTVDSVPVEGRVILRENAGSIMTYRNAFGLATAAVASRYNFGGVADFLFFKPTAGREALTTGSVAMLQRILGPLDEFVSLELAKRPEANQNANFIAWVHAHRRYELCGFMRARIEPGDSETLDNLKKRSLIKPLLVYAGNDQSIINLGSDEQPMVILARQTARRDCEYQYLTQFCSIEEISNEPKVLSVVPESEYSLSESALAFRLSTIVSSDYFVSTDIRFGELSHGLPVLVQDKLKPVQIVLQRSSPSLQMMKRVYEKEYGAFEHMVKDFVRNIIFPKISSLVPSATRQGAEAFLNTIQRNREVFEYEYDDVESLTKVWNDYIDGKITQPQAAARVNAMAKRSRQVIDAAAAGPIAEVVPDVIENEQVIPGERGNLDAQPPIERLDIETPRKLLTIGAREPALRGYRCFLALTERIRDERGDFFLQPHRTSIVWGGQKALFIFEHHSGDFGLYYEIQTMLPVSTVSGGGAVETCTIVMKNRIFIPIPTHLESSFVPESGEKKRLDVRCELLYIDRK